MIHWINTFNNSVLLLNKPNFLTSNQVLQSIKKYAYCCKIGHAGTLDPSASGILLICIGNQTKILDYILTRNKRYLVFSIIGIESDTLDIFGKIKFFNTEFADFDKKLIRFFSKSIKKFNKQTIPDYSSIKHNGQSLYKYSRLEIKIKAKQNLIKINEIKFVKIIDNIFILDIECSKGTYIRELVKKFSLKIYTPLSVYKIVRLKISNYSVINSLNFF